MNVFRSSVEGALAGLVGTAVMSAVLEAGTRRGVMREYPARRIVRRMLPGGLHRRTAGEKPLATVTHLGYGAAAGALFGVICPRRPGATTGIVYGLVLWALGYEGWVPRIGVLPSAPHRDRPGRAALIAAAHLQYGIILALMLRGLRARS